jgi:hypothetical protein
MNTRFVMWACENQRLRVKLGWENSAPHILNKQMTDLQPHRTGGSAWIEWEIS